MKMKKQTQRYSIEERKFIKTLIGQKLEWLENSEIYEGDTENDGTICNPLMVFENTQFDLVNDPIVDNEVNYDEGLFAKPKLVFRKTERREPRKYTGRYGEGGLTYEKTYEKMEINMVITNIKILHRISTSGGEEFFGGAMFVEDYEQGLVFIFEDDSYLILEAEDVNGDFIEFCRNKDQYIEENEKFCVEFHEKNPTDYDNGLEEFIDITSGSIETIVNTFRENELEEIINDK